MRIVSSVISASAASRNALLRMRDCRSSSNGRKTLATYDGPRLDEWILAKAGFWTSGHEACPEPEANAGPGHG